MTNETQLREEICRVGASLYQRGLTTGTAGNISARLPDGWLISPTDACLGFLDPASLARVDMQGQHMTGKRPSKTLSLHRAAYDSDPSLLGVVHTHSTHLVNLSLGGVWRRDAVLPPITPYYVMKVGKIPLIPYHRPGDPAVADLVRPIAQARLRGILWERLGPVTWGKTVSDAAHILEEFEETAKLWHLSGRGATVLDAAAIQELRDVFEARW